MNIDQFVVLDAVVRLGSFSAAARELNRVQSAISYNIRNLEEELGLKVFNRESYRPSLTDAGQAVYRKGRELLLNVAEIERLSQHFARGTEALLRMDITQVCPWPAITPVLQDIAREFPQTRLRLTMEIFGGEALVHNDEVDLSLTDVVERDDRLEYLPWRHIPMIPVCAANHPLAAPLPNYRSRAQMMQHVQLVVASTSKHTQKKSLGVLEGTPTWSIADFPSKKILISAGLGWGNLPSYMVSEELSEGQMVALEIPDLPQQTPWLHLVRKRWKPRGPVSDRIWQLLAAQAENKGLPS